VAPGDGRTLDTGAINVASAPIGFPGASPSVSASGSADGIVWLIKDDKYIDGPSILFAYNASNLSELYDSSQAPNGRDTAGFAVKFTTPTIANGKVYIGTHTELDVYGPLP
jgi:outer membrane protein assembly factor BamB